MREFCSNCGEKVDYQMNFCSKCGNKLNTEVIKKMSNIENSQSKIIIDNYLKKTELKKNNQSNRDLKSSLIIILGAISFIIIFGDMIGFYFFGKNISLISSYREFFINNNSNIFENFFLFISQILFTTILPFVFIILLMGKMKESIVPSIFIIFIFILTYFINNNKVKIDDYKVNNVFVNDTINLYPNDSTLIDSNLYK